MQKPKESVVQVQVAAIPFAQCFVLGTKFTPDMTGQATALTARACQNMCERTEDCCSIPVESCAAFLRFALLS